MGVKSLRDNFLALPTNIIFVGKVFFEAFAAEYLIYIFGL